MPEPVLLHAEIPPEAAGQRFDVALAQLFGDYSRSQLGRWIRDGQALLDGRPAKPSDSVRAWQKVSLNALREEQGRDAAQDIAISWVHLDEDIGVLDKPAGLVVHPGAGNPDGTLVNALLHFDPGMDRLPRAGIVHRLDKDTSGLMVVARSLRAHTRLVEQLAAREVGREYLAVVRGVPVAGGSVDAPIGRHPVDRLKMAVVAGGREAVTHYQVIERFRAHALLECRLETGRTHQIRVHMAHVRHPLLGDPLYGGPLRLPAGASPALVEALRGFRRQALHARRLRLQHPASGAVLEFSAEPPADLRQLLDTLREDLAGA